MKLNESIMHHLNEADESILELEVPIYDINALIDAELNNEKDKYESFNFGQGACILILKDGSGCIVDYEAVGQSFKSKSEEINVSLVPKSEGPDSEGKHTIYIMPTASVNCTVDELLQAPSKKMKVKDFFEKYNYNDRCARNFANIEKYITGNVNQSMNEAFNPENEEKNKVIRQALNGPKSYVKNLKALQNMGINKGYKEDPEMYPGETIYLNGSNGKQLSVDPDGTNVWHTGGSSEKHYKKELEFKNRHSKNYNNMDRLDFKGDRAKAFDYYNYFTKPKNEYQDEVDKANEVKNYRDNKGKKGYNLPDEALTPEEKSLNKRTRKYMQLKKDRADLEDKLAGYEEDKNKLDQINKDIKGLHEDEELEKSKDIKSLAESIKNILSQCNADVSYVDYWSDGNKISISCKIKPDSLSKYDNDVSIYGDLFFDENLNLVKSDIMTSSGPNILNYDFIRVLNALYGYFSSGNKHYEI